MMIYGVSEFYTAIFIILGAVWARDIFKDLINK